MSDKESRKTFRDRLERLVGAIRDDIAAGRRQPGHYLPSEKELGTMFGMSNRSVRKGLDMLVAEGLIVKKPKIGNVIAEPPGTERRIVRFGYYTSLLEEAALDTLLDMFGAAYPGIQVVPVPIGDATPIADYIEAGLLDVVTVNYNAYRRFAEADRLSLFAPQPAPSGVFPYLTELFAAENGGLAALPFVFSPLVLCYNRRHFAECGVAEPDGDWIWDELARAADELAARSGHCGFYMRAQSANRWPILLLQSGARFARDDSGHAAVCGTAAMDGLRLCRELIGGQRILPIFDTDEDAERLFVQERVSMIVTSYFRLNLLKTAGFDYDIAPLPRFRQAKTMLLAIAVAVRESCGEQDAAQRLADFLLSEQAQLVVRQRTLSIPALRAAAEWTGRETMYRPARFGLYRDIAPTFALYTELGLTDDELHAVQLEAKQYWAGLLQEDKLCRRLERLLAKEPPEPQA